MKGNDASDSIFSSAILVLLGLIALANQLSHRFSLGAKRINLITGVLGGLLVCLVWPERVDFPQTMYMLKFLFAAIIAPSIVFER